MVLETYLMIGIMGAVLGSFCNLLIHRLPKGQDIVIKRSYCPSCDKPLGVFQLIPIFSYLIQKGKCAFCSQKIAIRYFLVELTAVMMGVLIWHYYGLSIQGLQTMILLFSLLVLFWTDVETHLLPNTITYPLIGINLIFAFVNNSLPDAVIAALIGYGVLWGIGWIAKLIYKREAMGIGDMKMAAGIGAALGVQGIILTLYFSFMLGGVMAVGALLRGKSKTDYIPFGPAIIIASIIAMVWGVDILTWYLKM